jgi:hypothetical protein
VPLLAALAGSVAIGVLLGVGVGLAAARVVAVAAHVRRRRASEPCGWAADPRERDAPRAPQRCRAAEGLWAIGDATGVMPFTDVGK